jgi:hypothetical protein
MQAKLVLTDVGGGQYSAMFKIMDTGLPPYKARGCLTSEQARDLVNKVMPSSHPATAMAPGKVEEVTGYVGTVSHTYRTLGEAIDATREFNLKSI